MATWSPDSWQGKNTQQQPEYPEPAAVAKVVEQLSRLPSLVTSTEVDVLKQQIGQASLGKRFILQGGDCAESFASADVTNVSNKLKILLQFSLVLLYGLGKPVTRIGRIAGQYAKPRSELLETKDGISLPSYRGDIVNAPEFTAPGRIPQPENMLQGYYSSATTLNYIRALVSNGFTDLHHPENWNLDFIKHSSQAKLYHQLTESVADLQASSHERIDFFTSHEALLLPYEQALTHQNENGKWYDLSTHFPWIGMRTGNLDGGHIEYCRGIANPIAVKVGPNANAEWITQLIEVLNPNNELGRLTLITRFGSDKIDSMLAPLIEAAKRTGKQVLWSCDPMHGNTQTTADGIKTRRFDDILSELQQAFTIHEKCGSHLGGVHFELTGEDVTECIGGVGGVSEKDLTRAYQSLVDPRLNYQQALEMAMLVVQKIGVKNVVHNIQDELPNDVMLTDEYC